MTWTPDRPTKPGKYWLSIGIDHREKFASDVCREPHHVYLLDIFEEGGGLWLDGVVEVGHCLPASALFNRYVEPADPHAQPDPAATAGIRAIIRAAQEQAEQGGDPTHELMQLLDMDMDAQPVPQPVPSLRSRVEGLSTWRMIWAGEDNGDYVKRSEVLALLESEGM